MTLGQRQSGRLAPAPSGERDGDADQGDDCTKDGPGVLLSPGSLVFARSTRRPFRHSQVSSDETAGLPRKAPSALRAGALAS